MTDTRFIIGCGTGRCGTRSLAKILSSQADTEATHEARPLLRWDDILTPQQAADRLARMWSQRREPKVVADVCLAYGPHLEAILKCGLDVYVIILKRNDTEVAQSFLRKCGNVNHWSTDQFMVKPDVRYREWMDQYPKFDLLKRQALERYITEYGHRTRWVANRWPDRVQIFPTKCLSDRAAVCELLKDAGFESPKVVTPHLNKGS